MTEPAADSPARRLFFALWPDEELRETLRRATRAAVRHCGGKPVPPQNYHITLAFLGYVPAALFQRIVTAARLVPVPLMTLELDRFGYWPRPRVFWLGPSRLPRALTVLVDTLWERMEELGLERERRIFRPHLSLCRKVRAAPATGSPVWIPWAIRELALVESVNTHGGARYTVVARFPGAEPDEGPGPA